MSSCARATTTSTTSASSGADRLHRTSSSRPSISTSARTRSTATRRRARAAAPALRSSASCSIASPPGWRRSCRSPWKRPGCRAIRRRFPCIWSSSRDSAGGMARRGAGREVEEDPRRAPRRHRRARNRAPRQAHRLLARSRARSFMSPMPDLLAGAGRRGLRRNLHHLRRHDRCRCNGPADAFRLDDVADGQRRADAGRRRQMRPLLAHHGRCRLRSGIPRRVGPRCRGAARTRLSLLKGLFTG